MLTGCTPRQPEMVPAMLAVVQYSAADFANRVVDMGSVKVVFVVRVVLAEIVVEQKSIAFGWDQMAPVEDLYTYLGQGSHADVVGLRNSSGLGLMALEVPVAATEPRWIGLAAGGRSRMPHLDQLEGSSLAQKA